MNRITLPGYPWALGLFIVLAVGASCAGGGAAPGDGGITGIGGSGGIIGGGADRPLDMGGGEDAGTGGAPIPGEDAGGDDQGTGGMGVDPRKTNGLSCGMDSDCRSGFCIDGVCCNEACTGNCVSCAVKGSVGACVPAEIGTDPRDKCPDQGLGSCGTDGVCDGSGACRKYPAGATCAPVSCTGSTMNLISRCDGNGACKPTAAQSCAPFACDTTGMCRTSCKVDGDCVAPSTCVGGSCGKKPLGAACSDAGQCNSGFCEQGTCCGAACAGLCKSCGLPGTAGSCATVPAGQDPLNQCADSGAAACGTDGTCNGAGGCRSYLSGTICGPSTCSGGSESGTRRCDGSGVCGAGVSRSCDRFACGPSGTCLTACTSSTDCATDYICLGGTCTKKAAGLTCVTGTECLTGVCQQGVCCNRLCTGGCRACNLAGLAGTCTSVPAGQDPLNQCPDTGAPGCGTDGACDGDGACRLYANGTVCGPGTCNVSLRTVSSRCNGLGACAPGMVDDCAPSLCTPDGACIEMCTSSLQCLTPNVCNGGLCGKKPLGTGCGAGTECASGVCAQGVCCNSACNGTCRSCALAASKGTCSPVPDGADPLNQCADQGTATCKNDGTCDGNGACRVYNSSTKCADPTCVGSTLTSGRSCDGLGTCTPATTDSCHAYACDTALDACRTTCSDNSHCTAPNICIGGECRKKDLATGCTIDDECASGFCRQGVCCASDCSGACVSCALAAPAAGTCTPIPAHQSSDGACPDDGAMSCKRNGLCDGSGGCELYANNTMCAGPSCTSNQVFGPSICDGTGSCVAPTGTPCAPNTCGSGAMCRSTCGTNADCVSPSTCVGNLCSGGKSPGSPCGANLECATGFCSPQGVCCDTACNTTCKSCALANNVGTCKNIAAGSVPFVASQCMDQGSSTCGTDGTCDGSGGCKKYATGTSCMVSVCDTTGTAPVIGRFTSARTCNATNMCAAGTTVLCGNFKTCATMAGQPVSCGTTCATDNDCAGTAKCFAGQCGGLKGEYFKNNLWSGTPANTRVDANVDGSFGNGSPFPTDATWPIDQYTVRWTGWLTARFTGTYVLQTFSDDGMSVYLNGSATPVPMLGNRAEQGGDLSHFSGNITLTKDQPVQIMVEYYEATQFAQHHLRWNVSDTGVFGTFLPIPTARLTPAP